MKKHSPVLSEMEGASLSLQKTIDDEIMSIDEIAFEEDEYSEYESDEEEYV